MGYHMRFVQTDGAPPTLRCLATALRDEDSAYRLADGGCLTFESLPCAQIEINVPGDGRFEEEIQELREQVEETKGRGKKRVLAALDTAKAIVAVQALFENRTVEEAMSLIDPLWLWLFHHHEGLVQADGEGYYTQSR